MMSLSQCGWISGAPDPEFSDLVGPGPHTDHDILNAAGSGPDPDQIQTMDLVWILLQPDPDQAWQIAVLCLTFLS